MLSSLPSTKDSVKRSDSGSVLVCIVFYFLPNVHRDMVETTLPLGKEDLSFGRGFAVSVLPHSRMGCRHVVWQIQSDNGWGLHVAMRSFPGHRVLTSIGGMVFGTDIHVLGKRSNVCWLHVLLS